MTATRVADAGLDVSVIGRTLETLMSGRNVTSFEIDGEQYDVTVALPAERPHLARYPVADLCARHRRHDGAAVQCGDLNEDVAPRELKRFNQLRAVTIEANLAPGFTLGEAIAAVDAAAQRGAARQCGERPHRTGARVPRFKFQYRLHLPAGAGLHLSRAVGAVRKLPRSLHDHADRAAVDHRGARRLWLTGGTLNVYSQIGLVTLIGLITKHGILIVEFGNRLQEEGKDRSKP